MGLVVRPPADVAVMEVGWPVYEAMLSDPAVGSSRLAFDGVLLEIMSPSRKHEIYNRLLDALVREIGRVWNIDILGAGSTTLKRKPRGVEADSSFYIGARAASIRGLIDKMALYAALGVPEFWRYDGRRLRAYDLSGTGTPEISHSAYLRGVPIGELDHSLEMRHDISHSVLPNLWHDWLHANMPS